MKQVDFSKYSGDKRKLTMYVGLYTGASIIGPLVIFGGLGYLLDWYFGIKPILMIVGVFVAFIFTNIFLYKKVIAMTQLLNKYKEEAKAEEARKKELDKQA